jgi:hypothetical protein
LDYVVDNNVPVVDNDLVDT